jgi:hypothetical protein
VSEFAYTVGGEERSVPPRTGFKTTRVGNVVGRIVDQIPDLSARAREENARLRRETPMLPISRSMAKLDEFAGYELTDEDFDKAGIDTIEVPGHVDGWEVIAALAPKVVELATREVEDLVALILADNAPLEELDMNGGDLDEHLRKERVRLMHATSPGEFADVIALVLDVIQEEYEGKDGQASGLGQKARALVEKGAAMWEQISPTVEATVEAEPEEIRDDVPMETPEQALARMTAAPSDDPTSSPTRSSTQSTSSEPPTDGDDDEPSTRPEALTSGVS